MIRCKSELFRSAIKLADCLKVNTKEDLKFMAKLMNLSIPTKLRKDDYATCIAEAVLASPDMWLPRLTHYELILLDKLVKAGPDTYIEGPNMMIASTLELASFIMTEDGCLHKGKIRYMICDELREAVAPYLNDYLTSEKQATRFLVEQYAYGMVNLYGLLPYVELLELLNEYLQDVLTKKEIADSLVNSLLISRHTFDMVDDYNSILYIQSPFLVDLDKVVEELYVHRDIISKKMFTKEEVFSAGTMPLIKIPNASSDELKRYMRKKLGYTEEFAEYNLFFLWYVAQVEENPMSVVTSMINGKLDSMGELQEAVQLFLNYINLTPSWFLKGYSSKEVSALFKKDNLKNSPPRLVAGPTMKAAGMDITTEMQETMDDIFREICFERNVERNVGRNDPCPCGSGKKYKKCCGRGN